MANQEYKLESRMGRINDDKNTGKLNKMNKPFPLPHRNLHRKNVYISKTIYMRITVRYANFKVSSPNSSPSGGEGSGQIPNANL